MFCKNFNDYHKGQKVTLVLACANLKTKFEQICKDTAALALQQQGLLQYD